MPKDATLVMLSGGLDSTTLLYKLLSESQTPIHAHYVHYQNTEGRSECEEMAVNSIVNWCQNNIRSFEFSRSTMDFSSFINIPWDYQVLSFMAAQVTLLHGGINRVAFGLEANEIDYTLWGLNWTHGRNIFDTVHRLTEDRADWIFPISGMSREDEFKYLPRELYDRTWSCRVPYKTDYVYQPCKECRTCLETEKQHLPFPLGRPISGYTVGIAS